MSEPQVKRVVILHHYDRLSPRVEQEIQTLRAEGYHIHVVAWARAEEANSSTQHPDYSLDRVIRPAPLGTLKLLFHLPGLYRKMIRTLRGRTFDIVHCTHIMLLPLAVLLGKSRRAKIVYDVHEFHLEETAERLPILLRWLVPLLRRLEAWCVRSADGVLTVDSADDQLENRYRKYNDNVAALYNVPDLDYSFDDKKLRHVHRQYEGRQVVLYVGGLSSAKGALQAIEVARLVIQRAPDALFLFIGVFHGDTESSFWERVADYQLDKHVEFISWLPYNEMLHYLTVSKVGLVLHQPVPRYQLLGKGNGRKAFTYMQFAVPIVAPEFGDVGQVVREEQCGLLVKTTAPKDVANAVIYLLEHPQEARALGERGRKAVQEKYNWGIERRKLLEVYRRLERDMD